MLLASRCKYSAAPYPPLSIEASNIFVASVILVVTEIAEESAFMSFFFSQPS
jgi:hypothetical protein